MHAFECPDCQIQFPAKENLTRHQRRCGHCVCGECHRPFASTSALNDHTRDLGHSTEFRCCDCNRSFKNIDALKQHLRDATHRPSKSSHDVSAKSAKVKCPKCPQEFISHHALQQHITSPRHRPFSNIKCIASSCSKRFTTPSGLLHHLESGRCSSGMNRIRLNELASTQDTDRLITRETAAEVLIEADSQLLSGNSEISSDSEQLEIMTPSSGGVFLSHLSTPGILTPNSGRTPMDSWINLSLRAETSCPFCPSTRPPFCDETALQQHLQSAAHSDRMFFCPLSFLDLSEKGGDTKAKAFKTLSGLTQHLESGACKGGLSTFRKVAVYLEMRLRTFNINLKLINSCN
jgi:hypothetical protein